MALMKCPECELQVSDKAISCPHCGYPLDKKAIKRKAPKKRMRLPNGFGSITKLSGQLRKPYYVRVTVGKNEFGQPIQKSLKPESSFETWEEAYAALLEYNKNPYDLEPDITVAQLYDKWTDVYFEQLKSYSSARTIKSSWAYCSEIYHMRAKDVRARHIKGVMENGFIIESRGPNKGVKKFATPGVKSRIKSMFNLMYDYAVEFEIVPMNYARSFDVSDEIREDIEKTKRDHIPFTPEESKKLWDNVDKVKFVDWILIQEYMGWRPQELATLRLDEINLDEWYMQAGMKTDAGKQRIVPIHTRIRSLVQKNYDFALSIGSDFLFNDKGQTHSGSWKMSYDKYAHRFKKVVDQLDLNPLHRPHDPRITFVTRAKKSGMDEYAIKRIVGHRIEDITESTYTKRDVEWLRKDIEKIK